jgi:hypothetical protein
MTSSFLFDAELVVAMSKTAPDAKDCKERTVLMGETFCIVKRPACTWIVVLSLSFLLRRQHQSFILKKKTREKH